MKFVYIVSKGTGDATLATIPFHLGLNGSVEAGQEVEFILAGDATELLLGDNVARTQGVGVPALAELMERVKSGAHTVHVCKGCAVARGATDDDLPAVNGVWVGAPDVARICAEADRVLTF